MAWFGSLSLFAGNFPAAYTMPADAGAYTITGTAVTLTHGAHFGLVASPYIAASAADVTTARLTAPSGKSTSDFDAGFISDDTNPLPTIDITADDYTEVEWCIEAAASGLTLSDVYQFRVVDSANTALDTYTVTPTWTVGASDYPITMSAGSYALTGATVGLLAGLVLAPASGAYALTGSDASLQYGYRLSPESATYTITGTDVGLTATRVLALGTTAYAVSGTATGLLAGYAIGVDAGSYVQTGTEVTLTYDGGSAFTLAASAYIAASAADVTTARLTAPSGKTSGADFQAGFISDDTNPLPTLDLGSGKYTELEWCVTADAGLSLDDVYQFRLVESDGTALDTYTVTPTWTIGAVDYPLTIEAGSYAISGTAVGLLSDFVVVPESGSYAVTGSDVGLTAARVLVPDAGAYTITGTDVAFGYEYEIFPDSGVYALTGSTVALTPQSPGGTYVITGSDITMGRTLVLAVPTGTTYTVTGANATLLYGAVVAAGEGAYVITGDVVDLVYDTAGAFNMPANEGSYTLTGADVTLWNAKRLSLDVGSYALTGTTTTLLRSSHIDTAEGAYTTTGASIVMLLTGDAAFAMAAEGGAYTFTGRPVDMRYGNTPPPDRDRWGRHHRCRPIIGGRR